MEFQYYGANCLRVITKKTQIVVDDNLEKVGLKSITKLTDVCLHTHGGVPHHKCHFEADMPGEYEVSGVTINGIAAKAHLGEADPSAVIYTITADDMKAVILG